MAATIITTDDLYQFKHELLHEIREMLGAKQNQKEWLRSSEIRKMLKISPGTLQNMRVNGTLPYTKIGGVIYYNHEDVMKVLNDNKYNVD
jgi:hypothetical protein